MSVIRNTTNNKKNNFYNMTHSCHVYCAKVRIVRITSDEVVIFIFTIGGIT